MTILDPQVISLNVFRLHKTTGEIVVDINFYFTKICVVVCVFVYSGFSAPAAPQVTFRPLLIDGVNVSQPAVNGP